ncbi:MAG: hypothetical protein RLZZ28_2771 [Bacteroidota bacterium]
MSVHVLDKKLWFPPVEESMEDGLLAMGGDLSVERLLLAYKHGIFPWYEGDTPLWWSPDPRFVLFPQKINISKSMALLLKKNHFTFTINRSFREVISNCKSLQRKGQAGTWITDELEKSVIELHQLGFAHSAEAWLDNRLVGGLYGIRMGKLFFGESMFSLESNASKFAFIRYTEELQKQSVYLIDCQVYTEHLESLGAEMIARTEFQQVLKTYG